ncbi:hypothetical protein ACHAPJ_006986 [Fusarium lateritium]
MHFSTLTLVTLVSAASAGLIRRVDVNVPAMTDKDGNVVAFNAKEVFQPTKNK